MLDETISDDIIVDSAEERGTKWHIH